MTRPPAARRDKPSPPRDAGPAANRTIRTRAAVAPLNAEPRAASTQISQSLFGWPLSVLAEEGDWLRVAGDDAYEGWLHRGYVAAPDGADRAPAVVSAIGGPADARRVSLGCVVRDGGLRRQLPLGALLDGHMTVESGDAADATDRARRFPRERRAIVATALDRFAGTPYEWGGLTPWGADCSGLVQSVFRLHGLLLPRDAWQQALEGEDAGADPGALRPGDLLFFADRPGERITHVGIASDRATMVHLGLGRGGYAVERMTRASDEYQQGLRERFRFARRLPI